MARASGSYPEGRRFKSHCRYHNGPVVKRSRHRPFTAVTGVRFPHGSPLGSLAQLGEHLPYKQRVSGSSPLTSTKQEKSEPSYSSKRCVRIFHFYQCDFAMIRAKGRNRGSCPCCIYSNFSLEACFCFQAAYSRCPSSDAKNA